MYESIMKRAHSYFTEDSPLTLLNLQSITSDNDVALTKFEKDISQVNP
jgi:hypothetical protein